jgi:hypothetical protein
MKLSPAVLVVLALALAAPASHAAGGITLGAQGGLSLPIGDFADAASTGFHIGGTGTYMMGDDLGFGGSILFHSFGVNDDYEEAQAVQAGTSVDVSFSTLQVTAHALYKLPGGEGMAPYLKGGLGIYNSSAKVEYPDGGSDDSNADIGLHFGGGVHYARGGAIGYGLEAAYHYVASEGDATNLLTVSGTLTFGVGAR